MQIKNWKLKISSDGFFIALIIFLVLVSLSPVLFFGRAFFDEEQMGFYYPHSFFYSKALREGTSLLWNNGYYGGISVPFDQFISAYFPINLFLFSLLPWISAHHWSIFMGVLLGCLFAYFFGRSFKFSPSASFILSSSYLLATTFDWLDIGTLAAWSFFMIPALFLAVHKVSRGERSILWTMLGGVFIGVGFLAGFAQVTFYGYVIAGVFALYLGLSCGLKIRPIASFGVMSVLGVLFSLPQTLPSIFLVGDSIRTSTHALQNIFPLKPVNLTAFILPEYFNIPFLGGGTHGFYVGALPFLAAVIGITLARSKSQLFFGALYAGMLWISFHLPPLSWLNDYLPPFSHFSSSSRWSVAASFPLAFLVASGYENLLGAGVLSERERRIFKMVGWGLAVLFFLLVATNAGLAIFEKMPDFQGKFVDWYIRGKISPFPREHYLNILGIAIRDARSSVSFLDWRTLTPFLLLAVSFFLVKCFRKGRIAKESFEKTAAALVFFNVLLIPLATWGRAYFPASIFFEKPRIVKVIEGLEDDPESFRIEGFLIGESIFWDITSLKKLSVLENAKLLHEVLTLNSNVIYGIDRLQGAEYYRTLRHNLILDTVIFPRALYVFDREALSSVKGPLHRVYNTEILKTVTLEEKINRFLDRLPLLSAFNVKYIYSLLPLSHPDLEEIPLSLAGLEDIFPEGVSIHLYRNKNYLPRVYFANSVEYFSGDENTLLGMMADNKDFHKTTFIECDACPALPSGSAALKIIRYENGRLEAEVNVEKGGWLIFNESFSPGWEARMDGAQTKVYRANYIMQGVYVPPGSHQIDFRHKGVIFEKWKEFTRLFN